MTQNFHSTAKPRRSNPSSPVSRAQAPRNLRRKAITKAALLRAAQDVFLAKGYASTSVPDIVAKADLGHGTFYVYFHDKEDIFLSIAEELAQLLKEHIETHVRRETSRNRMLATFLHAWLECVLKHRKTFQTIFQEGPGIGEKFTKWLSKWDDITAGELERLFQYLVERGTIQHEGDLKVRAGLIASLLPRITLWYIAQPRASWENTMKEVEETLLYGMMRKKA